VGKLKKSNAIERARKKSSKITFGCTVESGVTREWPIGGYGNRATKRGREKV